MKIILGLALIAGGVTLAVVIGQRMSTDAMAVAIGVVFGVAASIPTSLLIVAATRGRRDVAPRVQYRDPAPPLQPPPPQIYIVNPNGVHPDSITDGWQPWAQPLGIMQPQQPQRRFTLIGGDDE